MLTPSANKRLAETPLLANKPSSSSSSGNIATRDEDAIPEGVSVECVMDLLMQRITRSRCHSRQNVLAEEVGEIFAFPIGMVKQRSVLLWGQQSPHIRILSQNVSTQIAKETLASANEANVI